MHVTHPLKLHMQELRWLEAIHSCYKTRENALIFKMTSNSREIFQSVCKSTWVFSIGILRSLQLETFFIHHGEYHGGAPG